MIHSNNCNPECRVLVLARTADSIFSFLPSFLQTQGYPFSTANTIYDVLSRLEDGSPERNVILIARPAMLSREALSFMQKRHPSLTVVGWCDLGENMSDRAFTATAGYGIVQVSDIEQLGRVLGALSQAHSGHSVPPPIRQTPRTDPDGRLKYQLCDDEIAMLLGVG